MEWDKHIILFDGECNFCSFWVKYVIKRDRKDMFRFASLQSDIAKFYLSRYLEKPNLGSVILIKSDESIYDKSTASLEMLRLLGGIRSLLFAFIVVPDFIRDIFYDLIAKNRYKLFGQSTCLLPQDPNYKDKFLM
jgi:predicted DCC family thiol-disulfide oxidoreductase YuxK